MVFREEGARQRTGPHVSPGEVPPEDVPLCSARSLSHGPFPQPTAACPATTRPAALSPDQPSLTQWTLSQKLKLHKTESPPLRPPPHPHPTSCLSDSPISRNKARRWGPPSGNYVHPKLRSAQQAHLGIGGTAIKPASPEKPSVRQPSCGPRISHTEQRSSVGEEHRLPTGGVGG